MPGILLDSEQDKHKSAFICIVGKNRDTEQEIRNMLELSTSFRLLHKFKIGETDLKGQERHPGEILLKLRPKE